MIRPARRSLVAALLVLLPGISIAETTAADPGVVRLRYATIVVRDYDEALNWYTSVLGLEKVEEGTFGAVAAKSGAVTTPGEKRWIVVAPRGQKNVGIILEIAKPISEDDSIRDYGARVGKRIFMEMCSSSKASAPNQRTVDA